MTPATKKHARLVCLAVILAASAGVTYRELGYGKKPPQSTVAPVVPASTLFSYAAAGPACAACLEQYAAGLASPDARERRDAAETLGGLTGSRETETLLANALADRDEAVRCEAAFSLGLLKSSGSVERLFDFIKAERSSDARACALAALGRIGTPAAAVRLREFVRSSDAALANNALYALAGTADPAAVYAAQAALARPDTADAAAGALALMDLPGTAEAALPLLTSADKRVRSAVLGLFEDLMARGSVNTVEVVRRNIDSLPQELQVSARAFLARN